LKFENLKFLLYFAFTITVALAILNIFVFYKLKRFVELSIYQQAYTHYMAYLLSERTYKGNEDFWVGENYKEKTLSYAFKDPAHPDGYIYVSVKPNYAKSIIEDFFKSLLLMEFGVVFFFLLVFELIISKTLDKLKEQEEWIKSLVASVAHKFGNFLSTQKVNLALLKTKLKDQSAISRLEKSILKVEKDMNLIIHLLREEKQIKREWIRIDKLILEMLRDFQEDLQGKKVIFKPVETYVYADRVDIMDILYNIISNAIRYSKSVIHIRICKTQRGICLVFRNDMGDPQAHGLGVGTKLVEKVVKRHGGKMQIRVKKFYTVVIYHFFSKKA